MLKFSWRKLQGAQGFKERDWRHDPLGHPALLAMSAQELADLPMVPEVLMRATKVEAVAVDCGHGVGRVQSDGCAISR